MSRAGLLLAALAVLGLSGCIAVVASVVAVGAVATSAVTTAGEATVKTVGATGRMAARAVSAPEGMTANAAAKLSRPGAVVAVEAGAGRAVEVPWQHGTDLATAVRSGAFGGRFRRARIFRRGRIVTVDLRRDGTGTPALQPGDVVELHR